MQYKLEVLSGKLTNKNASLLQSRMIQINSLVLIHNLLITVFKFIITVPFNNMRTLIQSTMDKCVFRYRQLKVWLLLPASDYAA